MSLSRSSAIAALTGGAVSGFSVDAILFPIDTIKTRLQSQQGFPKSGGFSRLYAGIGPLLMGSMPSAATFFLTYEIVRSRLDDRSQASVPLNMIAASAGEAAACLLRVPCDLVKQRAQVNTHSSSFQVLRSTFREAGWTGMYRGYAATVVREIPFSLVQYPLWEYLKDLLRRDSDKLTPWQSALAGALSGGVAAAVTTPIDVAKTRIMLSSESGISIASVLVGILQREGVLALFSGMGPRVVGISLGGAIFLGIYDQAFYWIRNLLK